MKRIALIGPGGAGKSTLARQIGTRLDLPVIHLDTHFWHEGWIETPKDEWAGIVAELTQREAWVMDGNYGGTMDLRLDTADTIVFLDLPPWLCVARVLLRQARCWKRSRPDMAPGCPEKLDWAFLKWIAHYRRDRRPSILERMERYAEGRRIVHLQTTAQIKRFLDGLPGH